MSHNTDFERTSLVTLGCRIKYKILLLIFKCIKNIAPKYLVDLLKKRTAPRATISAKDDLLLEIKRTKLVTAGDRSFVHVAPYLWNELPYSLRAANSVETFKTLLKTFLFRRDFGTNNVYCFIKFLFLL